MATERFTPSLFDKLTGGTSSGGDDGRRTTTSRVYLVPRIDRFGERAAREAVRRDLGWLFNVVGLAAAVDLTAMPEVERSVLNYGVPDLAGKAASRRELEQRARDLRTAIRTFEPRLDPATLDVEVQPTSERDDAITFLIRSDIVSPIEPLGVQYRTDIEVDTGAASVRD